MKELVEFLTNDWVARHLWRGSAPAWVSHAAQPVLAFALLCWLVSFVWKSLHDPVSAVIDWVRRRRDPALQAKLRVRQQFAAYLLDSLQRLEAELMFDPRRFAQLEAEYYTGARVTGSLWRRLVE